MRQAVPEVIGISSGEDLGLGFKTAKGARVNDAVAVPLKIVAIGMLGFSEAASAGSFDVHRVGGEHAWSLSKPVPSTQLRVPSKLLAAFLLATGNWLLATGNCFSLSACPILPWPA
jgi:hypothetical protein